MRGSFFLHRPFAHDLAKAVLRLLEVLGALHVLREFLKHGVRRVRVRAAIQRLVEGIEVNQGA